MMAQCFYCYNDADAKYDVNFTDSLVKVEFAGLHICQRCADTMRGVMSSAIMEFLAMTHDRMEKDFERERTEIHHSAF